MQQEAGTLPFHSFASRMPNRCSVTGSPARPYALPVRANRELASEPSDVRGNFPSRKPEAWKLMPHDVARDTESCRGVALRSHQAWPSRMDLLVFRDTHPVSCREE